MEWVSTMDFLGENCKLRRGLMVDDDKEKSGDRFVPFLVVVSFTF